MNKKIQATLVGLGSAFALTLFSYPFFYPSQCQVQLKHSTITTTSGEVTGTITPAYGVGIASKFKCEYGLHYSRFSIKHPLKQPITFYPDTCKTGLDRIVSGPDVLGFYALTKDQTTLGAEFPPDRIRGIGKCSAQGITVTGTDLADGTGIISAHWQRAEANNSFEITGLPLQTTQQLSLADQAQELCDKPKKLSELALLTTNHARLSLRPTDSDKPGTLNATLHFPHNEVSTTISYDELEQGTLFRGGANNPLSAFRPGDMAATFRLLTGAHH